MFRRSIRLITIGVLLLIVLSSCRKTDTGLEFVEDYLRLYFEVTEDDLERFSAAYQFVAVNPESHMDAMDLYYEQLHQVYQGYLEHDLLHKLQANLLLDDLEYTEYHYLVEIDLIDLDISHSDTSDSQKTYSYIATLEINDIEASKIHQVEMDGAVVVSFQDSEMIIEELTLDYLPSEIISSLKMRELGN